MFLTSTIPGHIWARSSTSYSVSCLLRFCKNSKVYNAENFKHVITLSFKTSKDSSMEIIMSLNCSCFLNTFLEVKPNRFIVSGVIYFQPSYLLPVGWLFYWIQFCPTCIFWNKLFLIQLSVTNTEDILNKYIKIIIHSNC